MTEIITKHPFARPRNKPKRWAEPQLMAEQEDARRQLEADGICSHAEERYFRDEEGRMQRRTR